VPTTGVNTRQLMHGKPPLSILSKHTRISMSYVWNVIRGGHTGVHDRLYAMVIRGDVRMCID